MGPFRTINLPTTLFFKDSNLNLPDFASSPSSGDNKMIGDTVPCEEDTLLNNDVFDTQVLEDNPDSVETQPIDFEEETQIMELSGETQVIDDNDHDFVDYMDTQLLHIPDYQDCQCKSDKEGPEGTQILDDIVASIDARLQGRSDAETSAPAEKETSHFRQDNGEARPESLPSDNVSQNSGSLKKGFASVRTASLRAAGLAARQTASKSADSGSTSTVISSAASELHPFEDHGVKCNGETVGLVTDTEKGSNEGLGDGDNRNVARSLARKLFLEEGVPEIGSDDNVCDSRDDLSQLPSCDNDMARLSYVDSQEPGELSQANALEVVDKFLKFSVLESDQGVMHKKVVSDLVSPGGLAKGVHSVVKQATRKSTFAEGSIYDWDDNLEDEGGGEFFTKKHKVLFGTVNKIHKSCPKPQSSWHHEARGSQSVGKLRNEKQNLGDTLKGFSQYDMKSVNGGKSGEVEMINIEKNSGNCTDQQLVFTSGSLEELAVVHNAQSVDMQNVGIDTQMAAEAMEALSVVNALVGNDCSMGDQGCQIEKDGSKKEAIENGPLKHVKKSNLQKQACPSTAGVLTRSRTKRTIKTRRQSVTGTYDGGLVYTRAKRNRLCVNDVAAGTSTVSIDGKRTNSNLEGCQNTNLRPPLKRRSLRKETSISTPVVQEASKCIEHHLSGADDASGNSAEHISLQVVHERKSRTRDDIVSMKSNYRNETLDQRIADDCSKVDGSNRKRGDIEHISIQDNPSCNKDHTPIAYGGQRFTVESIARRTRSRRRTTQCVECPRDEKGKRSQECPHLKRLSAEDASLLSSKKQDACSSPVKGTLGSVKIDVSLGNVNNSANSADSTPVNLKAPRNAVSPVCVGDGYYSPSCKKSLSLKEILSLTASEHKYSSPSKGLRHRRDMKNVCVLFSQHLDDDTIRQQKKILSRLDISEATTISEATHFVADMFVRTRNMLEAIANAKPVVTHLWLESCGQANCFIDEKNYILRDAKKEKELGFSLPKSLAHASQHPLLEGRRVLITPNVKPGKAVISSLVKAVHGQAVERLGRSTANDELFVLSCEEDFGVCVPLLEKGILVYSSELLLNGIITQRLEYERYRLFVAHVKKTRSTLWLNKTGGKFLPVAKIK